MAIHITRLNGGDITIGSGGSAPATRTATRVWYGNDENVYTDYEIEGAINGSYNEMYGDDWYTDQIPNVASAKKIEIGSTVTSLGSRAFFQCQDLISISIPDTVTSIGSEAFDCTYNLANMTFEGKDRATVQGMSNYPWGFNATWVDKTIHCTDGDIQFPTT